jgi:NAD(P)H-hydrate epimerase
MSQRNHPALWENLLPRVQEDGHKYDRGCAVVFGGPKMTGAARLASTAAMRIGAGLCVVVSPKIAGSIYRSSLPAHIIVEDFKNIRAHLEDARRKAVLIGPGAGSNIRKDVLDVLAAKKPTVLDADALTTFEKNPSVLFDALHKDCVLTPHEGEFARLFPDLQGDKFLRAEKAAAITNCTVLIKGEKSVIAVPNETTVINQEAAPYLATAGSGDVLAGMITGLMAQGMPPFAASCAAVYFHCKMAQSFGIGLVASDLPDLIPFVLKSIG